MLLCVLAADAEDEGDVALQIHFTLLRAFCCDQGVDVVRVAGLGRLGQLLGPPPAPPAARAREPPRDLHCVLVTVSTPRTEGWGRVDNRKQNDDNTTSTRRQHDDNTTTT